MGFLPPYSMGNTASPNSSIISFLAGLFHKEIFDAVTGSRNRFTMLHSGVGEYSANKKRVSLLSLEVNAWKKEDAPIQARRKRRTIDQKHLARKLWKVRFDFVDKALQKWNHSQSRHDANTGQVANESNAVLIFARPYGMFAKKLHELANFVRIAFDPVFKRPAKRKRSC